MFNGKGVELMQARFPLVAGMLVRGQVIAQLRSAALMLGLDLDVHEEKGLLESVYVLTVSGPEKDLGQFMDWGNRYFQALRDGPPKKATLKGGLFARLRRWGLERESRKPLGIFDMDIPLFSNEGRDQHGRLIL